MALSGRAFTVNLQNISTLKYGGMVLRFLSHNYNIMGNYAGFGRFINAYRKEIYENNLSKLLNDLFRILYFREGEDQQEAHTLEKKLKAQADAAKSSPSKDADAVRSHRAAVSPQKPDLPKFLTSALSITLKL